MNVIIWLMNGDTFNVIRLVKINFNRGFTLNFDENLVVGHKFYNIIEEYKFNF